MAIETEERIIESVEIHDQGARDEYLEIKVDRGWIFAGVKTRNTYVEHIEGEGERKLAYLFQPGAITRWWGGAGYAVHQIEVLVKDLAEHPKRLEFDPREGFWQVVWDCTNDFQTLEESKAASDAYVAFIEKEADLLAHRIDQGISPEEAETLLDDGHSGNTAAWAWTLGCQKAKNQEAAQLFRDFWNAKWAPDQEVAAGAVVNPAVFSIGEGGNQ